MDCMIVCSSLVNAVSAVTMESDYKLVVCCRSCAPGRVAENPSGTPMSRIDQRFKLGVQWIIIIVLEYFLGFAQKKTNIISFSVYSVNHLMHGAVAGTVHLQ